MHRKKMSTKNNKAFRNTSKIDITCQFQYDLGTFLCKVDNINVSSMFENDQTKHKNNTASLLYHFTATSSNSTETKVPV